MSETRFTPGEWIWDGNLFGIGDPPGEKPGVFDSLGFIHPVDGDERDTMGPETAANANLIIAAPNMYAALDDAHAFVKHTLEFFDWYKWPNVHEAVVTLAAKLSAALTKANPPVIPGVEITKHTTGMLPEIAGG